MSKNRNYTNYSKFEPEVDTPVVEETPVEIGVVEEAVVEETPVEESVVNETIVEEAPVEETSKVILGVVSDCNKLNIRSGADKNSNVEAVVPVDTKLQIDLEKSTNDWYSVCTEAGIEGYCMKMFVSIEE